MPEVWPKPNFCTELGRLWVWDPDFMTHEMRQSSPHSPGACPDCFQGPLLVSCPKRFTFWLWRVNDELVPRSWLPVRAHGAAQRGSATEQPACRNQPPVHTWAGEHGVGVIFSHLLHGNGSKHGGIPMPSAGCPSEHLARSTWSWECEHQLGQVLGPCCCVSLVLSEVWCLGGV